MTHDEPTRTCTGPCGETKPVSHFYSSTTKRGHQSRCKVCWSVANSASERRKTRKRIDDPLLRAQLDYIAKLDAEDKALADAGIERMRQATAEQRPVWRDVR